MNLLLEYGAWGAVVAVVGIFVHFIRTERKRMDVIFLNHLKHTYDDHAKLTVLMDKIKDSLVEIVIKLRRLNGEI